jgi:Dyp-type peroxidase family
MARNLSLEPALPTTAIQADILVGLLKKHEHFIFFQIVNPPAFKTFLKTLHITSMQDTLDQKNAIQAARDAAKTSGKPLNVLPTPGLNVAFTYSGLAELGITGIPSPDPDLDLFKNGMHASQATLKDPPSSSWKILKPSSHLHGVFIVTGSTHAEVVDVISLRLVPATGNGWKKREEAVGQVRPNPVKGHEHFGYADGVSQPGVRGTLGTSGNALTPTVGPDDDQGAKGQDLLWPGEFVFGYPGQNFSAPKFNVKGPDAVPPITFMKDGAFLVFRRLAQEVPEFNKSVKDAALSLGIPGTTNPMNPDLLGAQMVGRWKSGAPIINAPMADDLSMAEGTGDENDFEFGGDRLGLKCPWAAHIRKAYPRDDVENDTNPSDADSEEAHTQTHRMLRRGIAFGPEVTEDEALNQTSVGGSHTRGLLFKCYVTSIKEQFEFVQSHWVNNENFSQPGSGIDAIIGQSSAASRLWLGAAPLSQNPTDKPTLHLHGFVHLEGGEYFFAPSIPALQAL